MADESAPAAPVLQRREQWVDLPQEEYPYFKVKLWVNYPQKLNADLNSGDQERMAAALGRIVLEHNGWCDEETRPYPPASERAFWEAIPDELAAVLLVLVRQESLKLPKSLALAMRRT